MTLTYCRTARTRLSFTYKDFGPPLSSLEIVESEVPPLAPYAVRVQMSYAPVNPSDLIPISGAYRHRIKLPAVAGYEGIGRVIEAPNEFSHLLGQRVLPLRGEGTWQTLVDCPAHCAIEVPNFIPDLIAARAYINPLAAAIMLKHWPVRNKTVLLSAAGSSCAEYLGRWAIYQGAKRVIGIYRSENRIQRLLKFGIEPISILDHSAILKAAASADIMFDALGGGVASFALKQMKRGTDFVAYGLLTGSSVSNWKEFRATYHRFHMRDYLPPAHCRAIRDTFDCIWPKLGETPISDPQIFDAQDWQKAIVEAGRPGGKKPILKISSLK